LATVLKGSTWERLGVLGLQISFWGGRKPYPLVHGEWPLTRELKKNQDPDKIE